MNIDFEIPEAGSDLNDYDYCPRCNHGLDEHVERRPGRQSEKSISCANCGWVNIEHLPRLRIHS